MDLRKLKTLIDLVSESNIQELEVTEAEGKVKIVKSSASGVPHYVQNVTHPHVLTEQQHSPIPIGPTAAKATQPVEVSETPAANHVIKAPMVGMFYRAVSPSAAPFVEVGQPIKTGQTVCIIEAMKVLNEIEADKDGVIKAIVAVNGEPVEFGESLFILE